METLINKVKTIKELNELMGAVINICSDKNDNLVLKALKQHKTNTFAEAQEMAKGILNPKEAQEIADSILNPNDNDENLEINTNKKSKKGA